LNASTKPLGLLGEFKNGLNFTGQQMGRGVPLVNVKDITAGHRMYTSQFDLVEIPFDKSYLAKQGDLFFVRSSVKLDGIGLVSKVCDPGERETVHCGFVIRFRPSSPEVESDYLLYLLRSPLYRERIKGLSGGAAIVNLSQTALKGLHVSLPAIDTQRRIATILSAYDDLIENNRRRIQLLEQAARLIYREWFVRLRFPGHERARVVDGVPEGWERTRLSQVATVNQEQLKRSHRGVIEYVDISSVSPGSIDATQSFEFEMAPGRARRVVRHGDVIWSCVRPNRRSHAIIWNPSPNLVVSTGFAVITPRQVPTSYLYYALTTDSFVGYLTNRARGGAYPAVLASDFEDAELLRPGESLVGEFDRLVRPMIDQRANLRLQNEHLRQARDLLLSRLMNGEIEVRT